MVLISEMVFIKLENFLIRKMADVNLYVEYNDPRCLQEIVRLVKERGITIGSTEVTRIPCDQGGHNYCAILTFQTSKHDVGSSLKDQIARLENVVNVEEL